MVQGLGISLAVMATLNWLSRLSIFHNILVSGVIYSSVESLLSGLGLYRRLGSS